MVVVPVGFQVPFAEPLDSVDLHLNPFVGLGLEPIPAEGWPTQTRGRLDLAESLARHGHNFAGRDSDVAH